MREELALGDVECPECNKTVQYTSRIVISVNHEHLVVLGQSNRPKSRGQRTREVPCTHCGITLQMVCEVKVIKVNVIKKGLGKPKASTSLATAQEAELMTLLRDTRMVNAFAQAIQSQLNSTPRNIDGTLLDFMKTAKEGQLPLDVLTKLEEVYSGKVELWVSNAVAMIVCQGFIRRFLPMRVVKLLLATPAPTPKPCLKVNGVSFGHSAEKDADWVKMTSLGMVPPDHRLFRAALFQSLGDRGRERGDVDLNPEHRAVRRQRSQ